MKRYLKSGAQTAACFAVLSLAHAASAEEHSPPKIDHILLEVVDLKKSIAFYHDLLGLEIKSQSKHFVMLQSGTVGVFLSNTHWDWDEKRPTSARPGWGCIRTSPLSMSEQPSIKRVKPDTELRRNHGDTFGEQKRLSPTPTDTFGR